MSRQRFDWIEFHRHLHYDRCINPQSAQVFLNPKQVVYDFRVKGYVNPRTKEVVSPFGKEDMALSQYYTSRIFATSLKIFFSCLNIRVGEKDAPSLICLEENVIRTIYRPRTKTVVDKILGYLRTVRVAGGFMPKEGATSFWYD